MDERSEGIVYFKRNWRSDSEYKEDGSTAKDGKVRVLRGTT